MRSTTRFCRHFRAKKTLDIQSVPRHKYPEAVGFMKRNYLDDPLMRALGINERSKETQNFLSALWLALLRSEMSLAAVYRNEICGLCINCPHSQGGGVPNDTLLKLAKVVKTDATRNLLQSWDKISREVQLPTEKTADGQSKRIMELAGLAVSYKFRRLGVARRLVQSTKDLAMLLGFDYVRVDCTNMVTAKICDRLGWNKIWEMPFEKFEGVLMDTLVYSDRESSKVKVYLEPVPRTEKSV